MVTATVTLAVTGDIHHRDIKRIVRRALEKVANNERDDDGIRYIMRIESWPDDHVERFVWGADDK